MKKNRYFISILILFFVSLLFQAIVNFVIVFELLVIIHLANYKRKLIELSNIELVIITALIVTGIIALAVNGVSTDYLSYFHYCILMPIIIYLTGKVLVEDDLIRLSYWISFICLILVTLSVFFTPPGLEVKENTYTGDGSRTFLLFFSDNVFFTGTTIIQYFVPTFFIFLLPSKNRVHQLIKICSFFLAIYCLYKSESRTAIFFIAFIAIYHFRHWLKDAVKVLTIILMSATAFLWAQDSNFLPERFTLAYTQKAGLTDRDLIWAKSLLTISENFWGTSTPFMQVIGETFSPHNNILVYWMLFGWINGIIVTVIFFSFIFLVIKYRKRLNNLVFIIIPTFSMFFVYAPALSNSFSYAFFILLMGLSMKKIRSKV